MEDNQITEDGNEVLQNFIQQYAQSLRSQMEEMHMLTAESANSASYNPILAQEFTQNLNLGVIVPTQEQLKRWLTQPHLYDKELRKASQYIENLVFQYARSIKHFNSIKTFRYDLRPTDTNDDLLDNQDYMNSYNMSSKTLRKLNIPYQFSAIDWSVMENGAYFGWILENDRFMDIIPLPLDYCYLTGIWSLGYTGCIDLTFYDRMVGLEQFVPEIYSAYQTFIKAREAGLKGTALAPYQYYPLPIEKTAIFVWNPNKAQKSPPLQGVLSDALQILDYKSLLKQKTILETWKVIPMQIPYDEKNNKFLVEYKEAAKIVAMIQQLLPRGVKTFATLMKPTEMNMNQASTTNNISGLGEQLFYGSVGIAGNLMGVGENKNGLALKYSLQIDYDFVKHMYRQYENFINFQLMCKSRKYTWQIKMYGSSMTEPDDIKLYSGLVATNNFPVGKLFALAGYEPFEVVSSLNWEDKLGIKEKLKPIISAFQTSGKENGRPENDTPTDGSERQKENDTNANNLVSG